LAVTLIFGVHIIIPQQVFEGGVDCGTRERAQVRVVVEVVVISHKCFGVVWGGGGESTVRRGFDET
jgi:hypothetical protein